MTPQEQQMLSELLNKIAQTPSPVRDPEADAMIGRALAGRPDALYLLTQMVLVQDIALKQAQQQMKDMQQRAASQPAPASTSFLGSGPWGGAAQQVQPQPQPQAYATQPASGQPSFLHSALTTASGVVAGEMAFSALRSLFGGGMGGGMASGGGFLSGAPRSETIVNNYYGDNNDNSDAYADNSADDSPDSSDFASDDGGFSDDSDFS